LIKQKKMMMEEQPYDGMESDPPMMGTEAVDDADDHFKQSPEDEKKEARNQAKTKANLNLG